MSATKRSDSRHPGDFYRTPTWCLDELLSVERIAGTVLDPGCGDGAILSHLAEVPAVSWALGVEVDPILAGTAAVSGTRGRLDVHTGDFLAYAEELPDSAAFDAVVGNPPYKQAAEFARAALGCVRPGGKVALLLRLNFLGSSRRRLDLVGMGSRLAHVVVLARRPSFTGDGRTDSCEYAWFVWQAGEDADDPRPSGTRVSVVGSR